MSMLTFLAGTGQHATVAHVGEGAEDRYGHAQDDVTGEDTYDAWLSQTDSVELQVGRDTIVTNLLLSLPPGAVVGPHDRVTMDDGAVFEVVGEPVRARRPRGESHVECRVRAIEG